MRIPIPVIAIPAAVFLLYVFLPGVGELRWGAQRIAGAAAAVIGYAFAVVARLQLGASFSVRPRATELVTHGFYYRLRNPIYVFVDLMLFGLILVFAAPWLFVLLAAVIVFQAIQARREAAVLQQKFDRLIWTTGVGPGFRGAPGPGAPQTGPPPPGPTT